MRVCVVAGREILRITICFDRPKEFGTCDNTWVVPLDCSPNVVLEGDRDSVAIVESALGERGIATAPDAARPDCTTVHATIGKTGEHYAVVIERVGRDPVERTLDDTTTIATVIESWARDDLGSPLLGARPIAVVATREEPSGLPSAPPRGTQWFAALESSYASDRTVWGGVQLGACFAFGPICGAVRVRLDGVVAAPSSFGNFDRKSNEVLLGIDIPFAIGGARLTPGFAAGLGVVRTDVEDMGEHMHEGIGGLRADVHATLSIPIARKFAIDVSLAGDLTQATHVETRTTIEMPPEPRGIARFAVGIRYGAVR